PGGHPGTTGDAPRFRRSVLALQLVNKAGAGCGGGRGPPPTHTAPRGPRGRAAFLRRLDLRLRTTDSMRTSPRRDGRPARPTRSLLAPSTPAPGCRPCRRGCAASSPSRITSSLRGWDLAPALAGAPHYRGGGSAAPSLCVQATGDRPEHRVRGRGGSRVDDLRALAARLSEQSRRVVPRRLESGDQPPHERGGQAVPLLCERVVSGVEHHEIGVRALIREDPRVVAAR